MAQFVIAGSPDCPAFVHVVHVARYLQDTLPNFKVHIIQKPSEKFKSWLQQINEKNNWYHCDSPIIWKELTIRGGIAHYLGGVSEFWEYVYDYYGLQSIRQGANLNKLIEENLQYYYSEKGKKREIQKQVTNIGFFGAQNEVLPLLLSELIQLPELQRGGGMVIHLYDPYATEEVVNDVINDLRYITVGYCRQFKVSVKLNDLLTGCQLLIILGDFTRKVYESETQWFLRNMSPMHMLADAINANINRNLRIIVAVFGPVCFNVNVLIDSCTTVRIGNIVGVTSDIGLGAIKKAADFTGLNLHNVGAPPVWGYVGVNNFIDVKSAIVYCEMLLPYQRALKNKGGSTLPLGTVYSELRFMSYLIKDATEIYTKTTETRTTAQQLLNRNLVYSKVRATISLIKLWCAAEPTDDIISLGICSNGAYGIPAGLVFSQPAILKNNVWVPFEHFPVMEETKEEIKKLIDLTEEATHLLNVCSSTVHL